MRGRILCIVALAAMLVTGAWAQDLSGNWQGTLKAGRDLRVVFTVDKGDKDAWTAKMYSIDQGGGRPIPVTSVTSHGADIKISVDMIGGTFQGKLSEDGKTMTGTWSQGPQPLPLVLVHATPETAWEIPPPPPPMKQIPEDAHPVFDVATFKPTREGTNFTIHPTASGGLVANDVSAAYLIKFAYEVHPRQITKGPAWLDTEKYDLVGKPDIEGQPNLKQMREMVQKLLADRLQLTFHHEKVELPAYAVTIAKGGPKLTVNDSDPKGNPGYGGGPRGMRVINSTIAEFIGFVLNESLDLPVLDQTELGAKRYNFTLSWTPDPSQRAGMPAGPPADNADAPPDIFTAMQQQLGLKLEKTKALVDVMVIDRVEKPSPN